MNIICTFILRVLFFLYPGHTSSCFGTTNTNTDIALVGCTPADDIILSQLNIDFKTNIDFIKWELTLETVTKNTFVLNIVFGESLPNTLEFKQGGQKKSYHGDYHISKSNNNDIYHLKSNAFQTEISLIKLNANIFHLISPQKDLLIGNGGWSYTLNNKFPDYTKYALPHFASAVDLLKDTSLEIIFDGRTPCQDFAEENNLTVSPSCFKLKWKLILSKDSKSLEPTTYVLKRTNSRETDITGRWTISRATSYDPNVFILQLDPDKPNQTISFLVGDKNVLFFLHKDKNLFVGNANFSFTLNRRVNRLR